MEVIVGNLPFLVFLFTNYLDFPLSKYHFYNKNKLFCTEKTNQVHKWEGFEEEVFQISLSLTKINSSWIRVGYTVCVQQLYSNKN